MIGHTNEGDGNHRSRLLLRKQCTLLEDAAVARNSSVSRVSRSAFRSSRSRASARSGQHFPETVGEPSFKRSAPRYSEPCPTIFRQSDIP